MQHHDCVFCQIINGEIPAKMIYEDQHIAAFYDVNPAADIHALVIPKKHIESVLHLSNDDAPLMGHLTAMMPTIAHELKLHNGFKTIINTGKAGGQVVPHVHYHILGGKIHRFNF